MTQATPPQRASGKKSCRLDHCLPIQDSSSGNRLTQIAGATGVRLVDGRALAAPAKVLATAGLFS